MVTTYTPSGRIGAASFLSVAALVPLIAISAVVYQAAIELIPLIYFKGAIVFFYSFGLGALSFFGLRLAKCRNPGLAASSGAMFGLTAVATSHVVAYLVNLAMTPHSGPVTFVSYLQFRTTGGWSLGHAGTGGGIPIAGPFVWLVWLLESSALCCGAVLGARAAAASPFCEPCGRWADKLEAMYHVLRPTPVSLARVRAGASVVDVLDAEPGGIALEDVSYQLRCCPACGKMPTLTVSLRKTEINGKNQKTRTEPIHTYILLIDAEADEVRRTALETNRPLSAAA